MLISLWFLCGLVYATDWESITTTVNSHKIHYYHSGSGTPIFLLTGYATTSNFWNKQFVSCLAQKHSVYLVDYWGINDGESVTNISINNMADDSFALSQAVGAKNTTYLGWSMGGAVAQQISFSYPDQVGKIVLLSPLMASATPIEPKQRKSNEPLNTYTDILNYVFGRNLYNYTPNKLDLYQGGLFESQARLFPEHNVIAAQESAIAQWESSPENVSASEKSNNQYLFIVPIEDNILVPQKITASAMRFKDATIIEVESSGHNISTQYPNLICQQVEEFIAK